MNVYSETLSIETGGFPDIIDMSAQVSAVLQRSRIDDGLLTVFVPGSTAGITTIEYEPGLLQDLPALCEKLAPRGVAYHHDQTWHDGNGYAHLLAALFKPSLSVPFAGGKPTLGTWQQVVLMDFDNRRRNRKIVFQVMGTSR